MVGAKLVSPLMIRISVGGVLSVKENYLPDPNRAVCHMYFKLNVSLCTEIEREIGIEKLPKYMSNEKQFKRCYQSLSVI